MQVRLASKRGFCFGVEDAIEMAEQAVATRAPNTLLALGPLIHNHQVVNQLAERGLNQSGDVEALSADQAVLIRAHGVRPEVLDDIEDRGLDIVDATCVLVKRAQNVVRQLHEEGYDVVMIGDREHPEVKGVVGYAPAVIIVDREEELDAALPHFGRLGIVAQTTHAPEHVAEMIGAIARRPFRELKIVNTLCLEVVRRQEAAVELAAEVDVMFVLGGPHSANTRELARLCERTGTPTYHVETVEQFAPEMVSERQVAGVTAGASTPEWVITEFVKHLEQYAPEGHVR